MAIVVLFGRSYRALPDSSLAGLQCCLRFTRFASWEHHLRVVVPLAAGGRSSSSFASERIGTHRQKQKQLWKDVVLNPAEWWDKVDKGGARQPDFLKKRKTEALGLKNPYRSKEVDARQGTRDACERSGYGSKGSSCVGFSIAGDDLESLCEQGQLEKGLDVLVQMDQQGTIPSVTMYRSLLKACKKKNALAQAKLVHSHLAKHGLESTKFLGEYVVNTLVKCNGFGAALQIFHRLPHRTVFSWTAIISGYTSSGQGQQALKLYKRMREEGVKPDTHTFVSLLKACGSLADLPEAKRIYAKALKSGCGSDMFVRNAAIDMYGKCASVVDAEKVFAGMSRRDVVSWTAMLGAYAQDGQADKALQLYKQMQEEGVSPDARTFVCALQACGMLAEKEEDVVVEGQFIKVQALEQGKAIHTNAEEKGCCSNVYVRSTLVSMYGKCGNIAAAHNVFNSSLELHVVLCNSMLGAYVEKGQAEKVLELYSHMQHEGVNPNGRTFVSALQACGILAEKEEVIVDPSTKLELLEKGKAIHADAQRKGYSSDIFVATTLISMYGKCGSMVDALDVFHGLTKRDVVSWNAILMACEEQGQSERAWDLYGQMQQEGVAADDITLVCLLRACSMTGNIAIVEQIRHSIISMGTNLSPLLANTLVHVYGKRATMIDAQNVFDALPDPDVISWSTLIAGYARQGDCTASLQCYQKMQLAGVKPNRVTFLAVLFACSHAGLVGTGVEYFESMSRDHGITPEIPHYLCMVDLLGRAGDFVLVEDLLSKMPVQPDVRVWRSLLAACQKHGNVTLGKRAFDCAVRLEPKHGAAYSLMVNIYADAGLWESAKEINEMRQKGGAWKKPGQSWIEHEQEVYIFFVEDQANSHHKQLYDLLRKANLALKKKGHVPLSHFLEQEE